MRLNTLRRRARDDNGGVIVEFGIMFPIIVLLISGLVTFAVAFNIRLTLTQAAREGVRVYALIPGGDWQAATQNAAQNMDGLQLDFSGDCDPQEPGEDPSQAWVEAARVFTFNIAFMDPQTVTLRGRAYMRCGG